MANQNFGIGYPVSDFRPNLAGDTKPRLPLASPAALRGRRKQGLLFELSVAVAMADDLNMAMPALYAATAIDQLALTLETRELGWLEAAKAQSSVSSGLPKGTLRHHLTRCLQRSDQLGLAVVSVYITMAIEAMD